MELVFRLLGAQLTVYLGPDESASGELPPERLGTTDHSFGFAADPVFPELDWGDDDG